MRDHVSPAVRPTAERLLLLLLTSPLWLGLGAVALAALALTGWGLSGSTPTGELVRDLPWLLASATAGVAAAAVARWAAGRGSWWLVAVGALPALGRLSAIFTGAY